MIETLKLQNFKVLRDVDVKLRPLTVIVGPNGSGKTSILQALQLFTGWSGRGFEGFKFHSLLKAGPASIRCAGTTAQNKEFNAELSLELGIDSVGGPPPFPRPAPILKLDVEKLAAPSHPKNLNLNLPSDGEGLSSVLAGLHLEDIARFERVIGQLKAVVPGVEAVHVRLASLAQDLAGYEVFFDIKGAPGIPASAVSDGTLLTLGLLTAIETHDSPLVLIDDFERGLHPVAQADLVKQIRAIQEERPDLQIVATSHSPYLLDSFAAEEVLLTALDEDGYAVVKPLTDHPEYPRWKDFMETGEFWSTVGEGWVTRKQPRSAA
jgi:predicted ATPase